jgi:mucin-19
VGLGKIVSITGSTYTAGTDTLLANYTIVNQSTAQATINAKTLTVSGIEANDKDYDGTVAATLKREADNSLTGLVLDGLVNGDDFTIDVTGVFASRNVARDDDGDVIAQTVTLTETFSGSDVRNYNIVTQDTVQATINPATLALSTTSFVTAADKVYDGNNTATLDLSGLTTAELITAGMIAGDEVVISATGAFGDENVVRNATDNTQFDDKTVNITYSALGGDDAGNYTLNGQATTEAKITAKAITIAGITAADRYYDQSTSATVSVAAFDADHWESLGMVSGDSLSINATGTFGDKHVARDAQGNVIAKTVNLTETLGGGDLDNYDITLQGTTTATINPIALDISGADLISANQKTYDGTTSATLDLSLVTDAALVTAGMLSDDDVEINASGVFADKNVADGKTVTISYAALGGGDAINYTFTGQATTTADITVKTLDLSASSVITAADKVYDGTATAALDFSGLTNAVLIAAGLVAGDDLDITGSGAFRNADNDANDANVAWDNGSPDAKTVAITYQSLAGLDASNYSFTGQATTTAKITPKTVTVSGLTASDKTYDRDATATIDGSSAVFVGVVSGESITVDTAAGVFRNAMNTADDFNAGSNKLVAITGTTYTAASGTSLDNYTIVNQATTNANITPKAITVTGISAADRDYDGTISAAVSTSGIDWTAIGVISGDTISVAASGVFANKSVARDLDGDPTTKTVTLTETYSGSALRNYTISKQGTASATISPKSVTVSGITASDKVYDGNDDATLNTNNVVISGLVFGDQVNVAATGEFAGKDVVVSGDAIQNQTVTLSGFDYTGTDAGNYSFADQATASAKITPRALTLGTITVDSREYNGNRTATIDSVEYAGLVGSEELGFNATAVFADKNVGNNKLVSITGLGLANGSGANAGLAVNYSLAQTTATASALITPKALTISGITAADKDYDGTSTATLVMSGLTLAGLVTGDTVTVSATGEFTDHRVARTGDPATGTETSKTVNLVETIGGADARNYSITAQGSTTATINPVSLTIAGLEAQDKVYDGNTDAIVDVSNATFSGLIGTDVVTVTATGDFDFEAVQFSNNQVTSQNVTINGVASGADLGNYTVTIQNTDTATITRRALTVSGLTAVTKVYNRDALATISQDNLLLNGLVDGDDVVVTASGTFRNATNTANDWNVGNNKLVTISSSYTGNDYLNYLITDQAFTAGSITPASLTISGITVVDKTYDGNIAATVDASNAALTGLITGDVVQVFANGFFADKNVNWDAVNQTELQKTVNLAETYSGADRRNYVITAQGSAQAKILQKALTIGGTTVADKVYDQTDSATVTAGALTGMIGTELVGVTAAGTFADWNVSRDGSGNVLAQDVSVTYALVNGGNGPTSGLATNYSLAAQTLINAAKITPKALTISGITANDKEYDGNDVATVNVSGVTNAVLIAGGLISGDQVTVAASGLFDDENVARAVADPSSAPIAKTVNLTETFGGNQLHNYTVTAQGTTTAKITPKSLTISGLTVADRQYDATTNAIVDVSGANRTGLVTGDQVVITATGQFEGADVRRDSNGNLVAQTVTIASSYSGADWLNYTITDQTEATATIEPRVLTISTANPTLVADKEYDQSDAASITVADVFPESLFDNLVGTQTVELAGAVGTFADANVSRVDPTDPRSAAVNKDVTVVYDITDGFFGGFASNYTVADDIIQAKITPKALTISGITSDDRDYDQTVNAVINTSQLARNGLLDGDDVSVSVTGTFVDKNVLRDADGNPIAKTVTLVETFSGDERANYDITAQGTTTATINPIALQISGITAADRVYDATDLATLDLTQANSAQTLEEGGLIAGDVITVNATGAFVDKNVARDPNTGAVIEKTVTLVESFGGADAVNYDITIQGTTTAKITPAELTASATRQYDGTAVIDGQVITITGLNGAETFTASGQLSLSNKHITSGPVNPGDVSGLTLTGVDGALVSNYQPLSEAQNDCVGDTLCCSDQCGECQ